MGGEVEEGTVYTLSHDCYRVGPVEVVVSSPAPGKGSVSRTQSPRRALPTQVLLQCRLSAGLRATASPAWPRLLVTYSTRHLPRNLRDSRPWVPPTLHPPASDTRKGTSETRFFFMRPRNFSRVHYASPSPPSSFSLSIPFASSPAISHHPPAMFCLGFCPLSGEHRRLSSPQGLLFVSSGRNNHVTDK